MVKYLPSNLKYLRKINAVNQTTLGLQLNKSQKSIGNWETGFSEPNYLEIIQISNYFGITIDELLKKDLQNVEERKKTDIKKIEENVEERVEVRVEENATYKPKEEKQALVVNLMPKVVTMDSKGEENMVLVTAKARAGYLNGYGDPAFISSLAAYRLPGYNNGIYRMFEVAGLSMHPTLNDGDLLITRSVETLDGIVNDRIHVVVTLNDGIVVKRVLNRVQTDNKLILKSDNIKDKHEYPNMVIHPTEVREIWFVVAYISRIMKSPTEMYERITNVEGELTIVLDKLKKAGL